MTRLLRLCVLFLVVPAAAGAQVTTGTTASGLYYEVSGSGDPVVLIHAFSVDRRMWAPQVAALEKRFRVIRYDLRGPRELGCAVGAVRGARRSPLRSRRAGHHSRDARGPVGRLHVETFLASR